MIGKYYSFEAEQSGDRQFNGKRFSYDNRKEKDMDVLNKFLQAEINLKEYYDSITNFISLYEIRKGEFEGNEYIIMKVDRDNFIIFPEYDDGKSGIQIPFSFSIYKNKLLDAINSYAQEKGIL